MNDFAEKMIRLKELEDEIKYMVSSLKEDLGESVRQQKFSGELFSQSPLCGTVSFSTLQKARVWSPSYFFPTSQADAVMSKLESCTTVSAVCKAVKTMIEEKRVKIGNSVIQLNEETLKILQDSELGRYVEENTQRESAAKSPQKNRAVNSVESGIIRASIVVV